MLDHFVAPGRIQPPMLTSEDDAQDNKSEEINKYAAKLREPLAGRMTEMGTAD